MGLLLVESLRAISNQTLSGASADKTIITKGTDKHTIFYSNARSLDRKSKAMLTSALSQSHFDYDASISCITQILKNKLQIVK